MGNGSCFATGLYGKIANQSSQIISYSVSAERLQLLTKEQSTSYGVEAKISVTLQGPGAQVGGNLGRENKINYKGKNITSQYILQPGCHQSLGLIDLQGQNILNAWEGDIDNIKKIFIKDMQIKSNANIRFIYKGNLKYIPMTQKAYQELEKNSHIKLPSKADQITERVKKGKIDPAGHPLAFVKIKTPNGNCALCLRTVKPGVYYHCKECSYYVCKKCRPIKEQLE